MMRVLWQEARDHIQRALEDGEYADVRAEHLSVLQYPGPDGERPSTLAARSGMSRQAINHLLGHLEHGGYLERHRDPGDRNARIITLTARGHAVMRHIEAAARSLEGDWARALGDPRLEELRAALVELGATRAMRARD